MLCDDKPRTSTHVRLPNHRTLWSHVHIESNGCIETKWALLIISLKCRGGLTNEAFVCRGVVFTTSSQDFFASTTTYGASFGAHSPPNYLLPANQAGSPVSVTLQDSSGAEFGLQSFWLDEYPASTTCTESFTISGLTSSGASNPACSKTPPNIAGKTSPVQVVFSPPCFAKYIVVTANNVVPGCYGGTTQTAMSLDDIIVCRTSTSSSIS